MQYQITPYTAAQRAVMALHRSVTATPSAADSRGAALLARGAAVLLMLFATTMVFAHHSFAVFFDAERSVTVRGTVVDFQFRNPHGLIRIKVVKDGKEEIWKAETNSPSILERRGWAKDTLKAGEVITVDGWPARDGSNYLRMRSVKRADGSPVGVPFTAVEEQR
jgi:hypothetical protein